MLYHRAYGRDLDTLVVTVIDNRRPMLSLMRGMLAAIGIGRIETYASPIDAFDAMSRAAPDLVIAASSMQPLSGAALVKVMRHALSGPLSLVPAMIMSTRGQARAGRGVSQGRGASGARAANLGEHALSPARLADQ